MARFVSQIKGGKDKLKVLHTSDWHIGKTLNGHSLLEDQKFFLEGMLSYIREERVDVLLISGDIYDRSVPPVEAVRLLDNVFYELVEEMSVQVIATAGNHDSVERLSYGSRFLSKNGLHIVSEIGETIPKVTLEDAHGPLNFYLLPYIEPVKMRRLLGRDFHTFEELYAHIFELEENTPNIEERNVLLAHGFFGRKQKLDMIEFSDSERSIGTADFVDSTLFDTFDYAALGHLHAPQRVGREFCRYSGSLLKYSVSEAKQHKGLQLLTFREKGNVKRQTVAIPPLHDLRVLEGSLANLLRGEPSMDYIFANLTDDVAYEAMARLRLVYPNILGLTLQRKAEGTSKKQTLEIAKHSLSELFELFYEESAGERMTPARSKVMDRILTDVKKGGADA